MKYSSNGSWRAFENSKIYFQASATVWIDHLLLLYVLDPLRMTNVAVDPKNSQWSYSLIQSLGTSFRRKIDSVKDTYRKLWILIVRSDNDHEIAKSGKRTESFWALKPSNGNLMSQTIWIGSKANIGCDHQTNFKSCHMDGTRINSTWKYVIRQHRNLRKTRTTSKNGPIDSFENGYLNKLYSYNL